MVRQIYSLHVRLYAAYFAFRTGSIAFAFFLQRIDLNEGAPHFGCSYGGILLRGITDGYSTADIAYNWALGDSPVSIDGNVTLPQFDIEDIKESGFGRRIISLSTGELKGHADLADNDISNIKWDQKIFFNMLVDEIYTFTNLASKISRNIRLSYCKALNIAPLSSIALEFLLSFLE